MIQRIVKVRTVSVYGTVVIVYICIWSLLHLPGMLYGTDQVPLHMSYVSADEQSPVNGALHILQDKSLWSLHNLTTLYYGPLFAVLATPAVVADFAQKYITGQIHSAEAYKQLILFDWGGILFNVRMVSLFVGLIGLYFLWLLLNTQTINPSRNWYVPYLGVLLLASNFYYFEGSHFFRHWPFVATLLLVQFYAGARLLEDGRRRWCVVSGASVVVGFGISYVYLMYQVFWVPLLVHWIRTHDWNVLRAFGRYLAWVLVGLLAIVIWHPYGFFRILGIITTPGLTARIDETFVAGITSQPAIFEYAQIIIFNHLPLVIAFVLLFFVCWRVRVHRTCWFWMLLLPALAHLIVIGGFPHYETRYAFIPIVLLIVLVASLFIFSYETLRHSRRTWLVALYTLGVCYVVFHTVHIGQWVRIMSAAPPERVVIQEILNFQKTGAQPTLVVEPYILGYVHTHEAYRAYMNTFGKSGTNLYTTILNTPLPPHATPLNVRYARPDQPWSSLAVRYDHVVYRYDPYYASAPYHPLFDYCEADLTRLWFYDDFREQYFTIK